MYLARHLAVAGALSLVTGAAFAPADASAQQIYKIVGPDGRVTFSDRPPADPSTKATTAPVVQLSAAVADVASFPFELRQAASRYPVTLYTAPGCNTCAQGRALLVSRGIPFSEKTVVTKDDADALQRLTGASSLPVLAIGAQQLKGFFDAEWTQYLDAAGYPKTSQLPATYAPAPATPLVALDQRPADAAAPAPTARRPPAPAPAPATPPADNPAGITF